MKQVVALQNVGLPVNRHTIENQICGAVIQGISYALFEDRILNRQTGAMVNTDMNMYKIAGPIDVPEIVPVIWREDRDVGVNSLGEPPIGADARRHRRRPWPTPSACRCASMPLTPDKVLAALSCKGERDMKAFDYLVAEELEPALAELAGGKATLKAGGIDLLDLMKERVETPDVVLSIGGLEDLRYIREEDDGVHIGCLTTLADIGRSDLLRDQVRRAARGRGRRGHAADSRAGHARRQHLPAAAVLVLPQEGVQLPEEGRPHVLRRRGREPLSRDLRRRAVVHRAPVERGAGAGGARCGARRPLGRGRAASGSRRPTSSCCPRSR